MKASLEFLPIFLREHLARHPRAGLPAIESKEGGVVYASWRKLLGQIEGLDYDALTIASERLIVEPASDKKHFTALAAFAAEVVLAKEAAKRGGKPRQDLSTHEGSKAASLGCERCHGGGLVTVFRRPPVPERCPPAVAAHCVCAMGRWMRRRLEAQDPVLARRVVDLDLVLRGPSDWVVDPEFERAPY